MCYKHKLPKFKVIDFQPTVTTSEKKNTLCVTPRKPTPDSELSTPKETFNSLPWNHTHILQWIKIMCSLGVERVNLSHCTDYFLTELFCLFVIMKIVTKGTFYRHVCKKRKKINKASSGCFRINLVFTPCFFNEKEKRARRTESSKHA